MICCMVNGVEPYPELDRKCVSILKSLDQHSGTATTTEIRTSTSVENRQEIHYRVNGMLEPRGFVTTYQPQGEPGKTPPKEYTLKDEGREVLETVLEEEQRDRDLGGRVRQLEDQVDTLEESLVGPDNGGNHTGSDTEKDGQILELIEAVERVESRLDAIESNPIFDEDMQFQLDSIMGFAGVAKDDYLDEMEEDELSEQIQNRWEMINTFRDH